MDVGIQWPLVLFTLVAGAGCGLLAAAGMARFVMPQAKKTRQTVLACVLALLVIGGLMSVFHLSHPDRFMGAIVNLLSFSGIALELIGLAVCGVVTIVFLVYPCEENEGAAKAIGAIAVIAGVVAAFFHGHAYFEVSAQQGWNSISLAFCYLFTSLTAGVLIYAAFASSRDEGVGAAPAKTADGLKFMGKVALVLGVLAVIAMIAYVAKLGGAGLLEGAVLGMGVIAIVLELAAVAAAGWFAFKGTAAPLAVGGAALGLGGGLAVRVLMWMVAVYGLNFFGQAAANHGLFMF